MKTEDFKRILNLRTEIKRYIHSRAVRKYEVLNDGGTFHFSELGYLDFFDEDFLDDFSDCVVQWYKEGEDFDDIGGDYISITREELEMPVDEWEAYLFNFKKKEEEKNKKQKEQLKQEEYDRKMKEYLRLKEELGISNEL